MRTLAIECATEACSAALFENNQLVDGRFEKIGRGHAERLIPMIAELPDKGRAERILVSLGPGSFTGVRIGLAAARALGIAWGAQVLGYPTFQLIAEQGQHGRPGPVTICMAGGHGEYFIQNFDENCVPQDVIRSVPPEKALSLSRHPSIVGSKAQELVELNSNDREGIFVLPDARMASLIAETRLTSDLSLIYGRPPDARLPGAPS